MRSPDKRKKHQAIGGDKTSYIGFYPKQYCFKL